jgi:hypothetical protein
MKRPRKGNRGETFFPPRPSKETKTKTKKRPHRQSAKGPVPPGAFADPPENAPRKNGPSRNAPPDDGPRPLENRGFSGIDESQKKFSRAPAPAPSQRTRRHPTRDRPTRGRPTLGRSRRKTPGRPPFFSVRTSPARRNPIPGCEKTTRERVPRPARSPLKSNRETNRETIPEKPEIPFRRSAGRGPREPEKIRGFRPPFFFRFSPFVCH